MQPIPHRSHRLPNADVGVDAPSRADSILSLREVLDGHFKGVTQSGKTPESMAIFTDNPTIGWGDSIINNRRWVASLAQGWNEGLRDILIFTSSPEIFLGVDRRISIHTSAESSQLLQNRRIDFIALNVDRLFSKSHCVDFLEAHCPRTCQTPLIMNRRELLSIYFFARSQAPKLAWQRDEIENVFGVPFVDSTLPIMPQNEGLMFINFLGKTCITESESLNSRWAQIISHILKDRDKVVVHGGEAASGAGAKQVRDVLSHLSATERGRVTVKAFPSRMDLVKWMHSNAGALITIDTGVFWAAHEITGTPSIVISTEASYITTVEQRGFHIVPAYDLRDSISRVEEILSGGFGGK